MYRTRSLRTAVALMLVLPLEPDAVPDAKRELSDARSRARKRVIQLPLAQPTAMYSSKLEPSCAGRPAGLKDRPEMRYEYQGSSKRPIPIEGR
jgi:hypothetical protein